MRIITFYSFKYGVSWYPSSYVSSPTHLISHITIKIELYYLFNIAENSIFGRFGSTKQLYLSRKDVQRKWANFICGQTFYLTTFWWCKMPGIFIRIHKSIFILLHPFHGLPYRHPLTAACLISAEDQTPSSFGGRNTESLNFIFMDFSICRKFKNEGSVEIEYESAFIHVVVIGVLASTGWLGITASSLLLPQPRGNCTAPSIFYIRRTWWWWILNSGAAK